MTWHPRVRAAVAPVAPILAGSQATNLALLVSANLARRRHGEEIARVLTGKRPLHPVNREVLDRLALA
jgi:hypothetical protein